MPSLPSKIGFGIGLLVLAIVMFFSYQESRSWRSGIVKPMDNYYERPKLLTFGMFVTPDPEQNPIDPPERFSGYHTALDLEILPGEENTEVLVYSICEGPVRFAGLQNGYGGVIIQECTIGELPVTVLYGHIDPPTFRVQEQQRILAGHTIAALAPAKSPGSGETRKHLHLGIHKGTGIEFLGYVQHEAQLAEYIDPMRILD